MFVNSLFQESTVLFDHCMKKICVDVHSFDSMVTPNINPYNGEDNLLEDDTIEYFLKLINEIDLLPRMDDDAQFKTDGDLKEDEKSSGDHS